MGSKKIIDQPASWPARCILPFGTRLSRSACGTVLDILTTVVENRFGGVDWEVNRGMEHEFFCLKTPASHSALPSMKSYLL